MRLDSILNEWSAWPVAQQPELVKIFAAGLNHTAAHIRCGAEQYVVKYFNQDGKRAILAQVWAAELDLAPRIIYQHPDWQYTVMEFVEEAKESSSITTGQLQTLGRALRKMHSAPAPSFAAEQFSLLSFCEQYLCNAGQRAHQYHRQLLPALTDFESDTTARCLCHNDLVVANCFLGEEKACFIDWEYAALNNPWFDLAAVAIYFRLPANDIERMVVGYQPSLVPELSRMVFLNARIAVLWLDILWHLQKFGVDHWPELAEKEYLLKQLAQQRETAVA